MRLGRNVKRRLAASGSASGSAGIPNDFATVATVAHLLLLDRSSQSSYLLHSCPSHVSSWPEVNPHEMRRVKHPRVGVWDLYEEVNPLPRPACHTATRLVLARGIRSLRHNCASFTCCAPSKMCSRAGVAGYILARTRPWWGSGTLASQL